MKGEMKRAWRKRWAQMGPLGMLLVVLLLCLACAKSRGTDSSTHFWRVCTETADCDDGLDCLCGRCSTVCDGDEDCGDYPSAQCDEIAGCGDGPICGRGQDVPVVTPSEGGAPETASPPTATASLPDAAASSDIALPSDAGRDSGEAASTTSPLDSSAPVASVPDPIPADGAAPQTNAPDRDAAIPADGLQGPTSFRFTNNQGFPVYISYLNVGCERLEAEQWVPCHFYNTCGYECSNVQMGQDCCIECEPDDRLVVVLSGESFDLEWDGRVFEREAELCSICECLSPSTYPPGQYRARVRVSDDYGCLGPDCDVSETGIARPAATSGVPEEYVVEFEIGSGVSAPIAEFVFGGDEGPQVGEACVLPDSEASGTDPCIESYCACTDMAPGGCVSTCVCSLEGELCRSAVDGSVETDRPCCDGYVCTLDAEASDDSTQISYCELNSDAGCEHQCEIIVDPDEPCDGASSTVRWRCPETVPGAVLTSCVSLGDSYCCSESVLPQCLD